MRPDNRLRALRKLAGLTQGQLADQTGVSQPAISQIENGHLSMDIQWLRAFARVLGCKPDDLLADDDVSARLDAEQRDWLERLDRLPADQRAMFARMLDAAVPAAANEGDKAA